MRILLFSLVFTGCTFYISVQNNTPELDSLKVRVKRLEDRRDTVTFYYGVQKSNFRYNKDLDKWESEDSTKR